MEKTLPAMPFEIDRKLRVDIATQVTDGIRMAILSGHYKPGDTIPTILEFAHGLHVSIRAPKAAYRTLKKEGLISPRHRLGTLVVGPRPELFRGRIAIVHRDYNPVYYSSLLESHICERLNGAGYLVAPVMTRLVDRYFADESRERYDVRQLSATLRQKTELAVIIGSNPHLEKTVAETGTPFAEIGLWKPKTPGCVCFAPLDIGSVLPDIAARLRERKVRRLVQVALRESEFLDTAALGAVCESVEGLVLWPSTKPPVLQDRLVGFAFEAFAKRYRTKADLPDAFLFTDDYLARGALLALLAAGIRTGRDVLVMTLANKGIVVVHPDPIDLILRDPAGDATAVADAILGYLQTGSVCESVPLEMKLVTDATPSFSLGK